VIEENHIEAPILKADKPLFQEFEVIKTVYSVHRKQGKAPSVKVSYWTGLIDRIDEWICPEHDSAFVRVRYENFCKKIGIATPPLTAENFCLCARYAPRSQAGKIMADYRKNDRFPSVKWLAFNSSDDFNDEIPF
jgi:hypothetical protein